MNLESRVGVSSGHVPARPVLRPVRVSWPPATSAAASDTPAHSAAAGYGSQSQENRQALSGDAEALQALHETAAEREAIVWCENGPVHEVDAALRAAIDGFEQLYRGEGFESVELDAHRGAGHDLAAAAVLRPRPAVPVTVEWPAAAADFCLLLTADDLPEVPFRLNGWMQVTDVAKMVRSLRADILRGPSGPRAFYGALQADLLALQSLALQAARIRENWRRSQQGIKTE